jgi:hypothetical protein
MFARYVLSSIFKQHHLMYLFYTPNDVFGRVQNTMAANKDPHTELRREKFRDYCEQKHWRKPDGGWLSTEIGEHFGRKSNQINNILTGHGSFGPSVANELALHAGLPPYYFEPTNSMTPTAYQLAKIFDSIAFPDDATRDAAFNAAAAALVRYMPQRPAR